MQSLSFHAYSLFSGLNNDKCASSESTWSGRTAIGRTDLRAKRPDTHLPHSLTTMPHNNYMITLSSKTLRGYHFATLFAVFIKTLKRLFISTEKTYSRFFFSTFDLDKFGKICRHHISERLKINKITKFESDLLKAYKDTALQNSRNFTDVCVVGGTNLPPGYKRL